jgi:DNA repair exonuclease SbcCD nuclease subunit
MSKIFIVGDLHFGVKGNSVTFLDQQKNWFFNHFIPLIQTEKPSDIIFLGDIFDSRNSLSPLILNTVREIFKTIVASNCKVHAILGNHDIFFKNTKNIHSLNVLQDQGVHVYASPTEVIINNKKCLMLPWIIKNEEKHVALLLASNSYDFCFGHLEINSFEMVKGKKEENGLSKDLFANCKKVYSGHFHLRGSDKNITYIGTPYELSWNDYLDKKGVYSVNTSNFNETIIDTTSMPSHVKISNNLYKLEDVTRKMINNNIVKLIFKANTPEVEKINFIEKINSSEPFSLIIDEEDSENYFENQEEIDASIKDTMGFLTEYLNIVELPAELDKKKVLERIEDLYKNSI